MESDVPLIEIAGEDDALLQLTQDDAVSSSSTNNISNDDAFFFCSPLQPRRSKPLEAMVVCENSKKLSSTFCRDSANANKENNNANKLEEQKLSLLPQKMKRKKKGGGYNLRKSLAWDRAFFTDEGVLNSEELSMISGNANSNGLLSVIEEDTDSITDSADLNALEENLFKVLPESPSSKKDRTVGGSSLPKHDSSAKDNVAPGSAAKRKVLSARDINRSGSKRSGCPRPVASSSLKRPANVNTMKSPIKEPKVSKIPVPKPDSCLLSRTSKNVTVGANDLKRNQIAHPEVKLNNTKSGPNNAKVPPTGKVLTSKSSVRQARRNVASLMKGSPTKISCPPTIEANNGLEGISKQAVPSTGHASYGLGDRSRKTAVPKVIPKQALPSTAHASHGRKDRSRKPAVPEVNSKQALPSISHASYGCNDRSRKTAVPLPLSGVVHTQPPTSKPSGLRMPSPSLGFFHQPKPSLPSPLKTSSQPCIIPNLRQAGPVDPIHEFQLPSSVGEKQNVINDGTITGNNDVTITGNNDVICSSLDCSVSSIVDPATNKKVESFSQVTYMQKAELKVKSSSNSCDMTDNQRTFNIIPVHEDPISMGQAEPYITEKVVHMEEVEFQRNEDKLLLQKGSCKQLDDNSMNVTFVLTPKSKVTDKSQVTSHLSSTVKFPGVSGRDITDHQLLEDKPHDSPQKNCGVFSKSKFEDASSFNSTLASYVDQSSSDHVNKLHGEQVDLSKPLTCEGDQMVWENSGSFTKECQTSEEIQSYSCVNVADVSPKVQNSSATDSDALCDSRFDDCSNNDGSTFDKMGENPQEEDAQMLTLSGRLTDEMDGADLRTSAPDNCQLVTTDCGNEKPEQLDLPDSCYTGEQVFQENRLRLDDCILDGFSTIPEEPQQKIALQRVVLKETEGTGACRSESEVSKTLSLKPPAMPDCRSNVAEMVESQDKSYNLGLRNDSQLNCQDCCLELESVDVQAIGAVTAHNMDACFLKSGDFTSQLNLKVLAEDTSVEPINLMGDKINFSGEEISVMSACCLNAEDRILNQSPEVHVSSFEARESFEECLTYNIGNCADVSSKVNNLGGSGSQSPRGLSKHKSSDEENKQVDEGSDMIKEPALGDLREHTSVSNYACSAVVNNVYQELAGCPELHCPNIDFIQVSQDINPGSCLNGTLLANNTSCKDFVETVHEVVFYDYNARGSESKSSKVGPAMHDCTPDLEEKADYLQMEVAEDFSHDYKLSNQAPSLQSDSSAKTTTEETSVSTLALNAWEGELCSSVISDRTSSSGSILQDNEVNASRGNLAEESEIDFNNHTLTSELQHELEDSLHPTEDMEATNELKKPGSDRKPEGLVIKPPSDAVPFSDEWLAALEAAGEEILTKKSGAVQNSPPNKSQPQLGPWSPVKRKANQVIGPFDCTKHTNNVPPTSQ